jgi:hypothetical protein
MRPRGKGECIQIMSLYKLHSCSVTIQLIEPYVDTLASLSVFRSVRDTIPGQFACFAFTIKQIVRNIAVWGKASGKTRENEI